MFGLFKSFFNKGNSKNKSKAARYLPLTRDNFADYYPDFNYIEVEYIGCIWQSSTFKQGKEWQRNSNFVKDYLAHKEDYIKVKKDKGESFKINDIAWSYYNRYKLEWVNQHIKRKIWTREDVRIFNGNTRDMSKDFKWVEKDKCREMLFNNDKEKRLLRKQLKEINEKLSTDKDEILINQNKEINIRIKEIIDENKILVDKRKDYLKTWYN